MRDGTTTVRTTAALLVVSVLLPSLLSCDRGGAVVVAPTTTTDRTVPSVVATVIPSSSDPRNEVASVARRFWEALLERDDSALDALVGFPFTWDAECRLVETRDELEALIAKAAPSARVHLGSIREVTRDQVGEHEVRSLDKLAAEAGCDGPAASALQGKAAKLDRRYVLVELLTDEGPVPTMTRISRPRGAVSADGWRVTGIDN